MRVIKGAQDILEKEAAHLIQDSVKALLEKKEIVVIGLVGGRSVAHIHHHLTEEAMPWKNIHFFLLDDRLVGRDDDESNTKLVEETLIHPLLEKGFPKENFHPFDKEKGTEAYTRELEALGGTIDLLLLSAGEDGHVAGLYPNHTITREKTGYFSFHDSPKPPKERMTASKQLLEQAQIAFLVFFGKAKEDAFKRFEHPSTPVEECPAKLVLSLEHYVFKTDS